MYIHSYLKEPGFFFSFEKANSTGTLWIHSFSLSKISHLSLCLHIEKTQQKHFLLLQQIFQHLYINVSLSRIHKKSISNCWFIAKGDLEPLIYYLMNFSTLTVSFVDIRDGKMGRSTGLTYITCNFLVRWVNIFNTQKNSNLHNRPRLTYELKWWGRIWPKDHFFFFFIFFLFFIQHT